MTSYVLQKNLKNTLFSNGSIAVREESFLKPWHETPFTSLSYTKSNVKTLVMSDNRENIGRCYTDGREQYVNGSP
jgi:hypothetical protein